MLQKKAQSGSDEFSACMKLDLLSEVNTKRSYYATTTVQKHVITSANSHGSAETKQSMASTILSGVRDRPHNQCKV